jgi:hypothetical protein
MPSMAQRILVSDLDHQPVRKGGFDIRGVVLAISLLGQP